MVKSLKKCKYLLVFIACLTSCGHTHDFNGGFLTNEEGHCMLCSCGACSEFEEHEFGFLEKGKVDLNSPTIVHRCTKCGYEEVFSNNENYKNGKLQKINYNFDSFNEIENTLTNEDSYFVDREVCYFNRGNLVRRTPIYGNEYSNFSYIKANEEKEIYFIKINDSFDFYDESIVRKWGYNQESMYINFTASTISGGRYIERPHFVEMHKEAYYSYCTFNLVDKYDVFGQIVFKFDPEFIRFDVDYFINYIISNQRAIYLV